MPDIDRSLPVVFIHGIGGGARLWAPQITSFSAAGYRPVALDLPGYGERPAVDRMDFEGLAADIEAEIARLGLARPALVGHSMGGMVAQTALRRRPHAYRAAVLACTSPAFGSGTGAFQKKFVADRLAPLEMGQRVAAAVPGPVELVLIEGAGHNETYDVGGIAYRDKLWEFLQTGPWHG